MKKIRMKEETVFDDTNSCYLLQEENKFLFETFNFEIRYQKKKNNMRTVHLF